MAKSPKKAVAEASLQLPPDYLLCAQSAQKPIVLPDGLSSPRAEAIRVSAKKWLNGTVLHYCFIDNRALPKWTWVENQKKIVRAGFDIWRGVGIGLSFVEVQDASEAEITIGCLQGDGSWSLVGVDNIPPSYRNLGRTMNFGWDLTTPWGKATAIHEIGHALGFSHEHQNPKSGIVWDEDEVYRSFSGPPNNWDRQKIFHNILKKLESSDTEGSDWNPDSIMEYPFAPGLIREPKPYDTKGVGQNFELSASDKAWVKRWYPVSAAPAAISVMQLERLDAAAGAQSDYAFQPTATRDYKIQTLGPSDCRLVIFEVRDDEPRHLMSQDDSGDEGNLSVVAKLVKGRSYIIRVRVNYASAPDGVGLLVT